MSKIVDRQQVIAWLQKEVSERRLQHILGVEQMCLELARIHHLDEQKAARAGLMHDLAKFFHPQKLLQMAREAGLEIDPICANHPHLLHADVSAIVAQQEFLVDDDEVLTAIANHTLGRPQMSRLCCLVFIADALEPSRGDTSELEAIRQVGREDLHQAVYQTCDRSLKYLIDTRRAIHPRTVLTRNWALQKTIERNNTNRPDRLQNKVA